MSLHNLAARIALGPKRIAAADRVREESRERREKIGLSVSAFERQCEAIRRTSSVDWMRQAEVVAGVSRETGVEHDLPVAVDEEPAPPLDEAGKKAYLKRNVFPHDLPPE